MSKKILVIGCGHVGATIADVMEDFGNDIIRIDPKLNDKRTKDWKMVAEGAVICLPTPTVNGKCDVSLIDETVEELGDMRILIMFPILLNFYEKKMPEMIMTNKSMLYGVEKDSRLVGGWVDFQI